MSALNMPRERNFGWPPKPAETTYFEIVKRENGQFCVVLNHSLLRGCTSEMIHWWFLHFPNLKVKLIDIEGYEGDWHLHNAIEVGTFENFLPAIYQQREDKGNLEYSRSMNSISNDEPPQVGFDRTLFERRVQGYQDVRDVHQFQAWDRPSFLASTN